MLKVCITYDYELFLGKNNASYDEILFSPTEEIIKAMTAGGARGTFFADVCSATEHKKAGLYEYSEKFGEQLKTLTRAGHDVQLHLHTSWLRAQKKDGKLIPTADGYRIHEFGFDPKEEICAQKIITESKEYLEKICGEVKPNYKCIAFRAGGFCIQPERELIKALTESGIVLDSSVVPYLKSPDSVNYYDFSSVPDKLNWSIGGSGGISKDSGKIENSLYEIPVASLRPRLPEYIGKPKNKRSLPQSKIKGEYVSFSDGGNTRREGFAERLFKRLFGYRYISLDTRYYERVLDDLHYIYRKYGLSERDGYVCLICHPKLADRARVENIKYLIEAVNREQDKLRFVTFTDIYNELFINCRQEEK